MKLKSTFIDSYVFLHVGKVKHMWKLYFCIPAQKPADCKKLFWWKKIQFFFAENTSFPSPRAHHRACHHRHHHPSQGWRHRICRPRARRHYHCARWHRSRASPPPLACSRHLHLSHQRREGGEGMGIVDERGVMAWEEREKYVAERKREIRKKKVRERMHGAYLFSPLSACGPFRPTDDNASIIASGYVKVDFCMLPLKRSRGSDFCMQE